MDNEYEEREEIGTALEDAEETAEKRKTNWSFLGGLICGAALTLACFGVSVGFLRWRLQQSADTLARNTPVVQQGADGLKLDTDGILQKIGEIEDLINRNYLEEPDVEQMEEYLYAGLVQGMGDPYSEYFSAPDLELLDELTDGIYTGIGATLQQDPYTGEITVVSCFAGTPSAESGMLPGDVLTAVNGERIDGMDLSTVVARVKTEEGETVALTLLRDGEELTLSVTRRRIEVPTVEYEMLENRTGYLQILEFDGVTLEQVEQAMQDLEAQGMERLVVDLRDNPGGVLDVVCDVLDLFLPEGCLVYVEDKYGQRVDYTANDEQQFEKPLAVLINENSASASEIFAGAIRDYHAGTLVGTTTFGKGIVQRVYDLSDGSGLKLTIARYYTPNGQYIHDVGIEPDVKVELDESLRGQAQIDHADDNQLQEALRVLEEKTATSPASAGD